MDVFWGCSGLTSVELSSRITEIPTGLFRDCTGLKDIGIPDSVTKINDNAFNGCSSLQYVGIGNSVVKIGHYVFDGCTSLSSIVIPDSVNKIGAAFVSCPHLRLVCIKDAKVLNDTGLNSNVKIVNPSASRAERESWSKEERDLAIEYMLQYELGRPV